MDDLALLEITKDPNNTDLLINIENSERDFSFDSYMEMYIVRKSNGLFTPCPPGWVPINTTYYLRVPSSPKLNQIIPEYYDEDSISSNFIVTAIDSIIKTQLGEIKCFVLENYQSCFIEYWNEQVGLIQIDKIDDNKNLIKTYKLSKIEYANSTKQNN
jgi:hypothetical protein